MRHPKLAFLSVGATFLFVLCSSAVAHAAVEFCPATASVPSPIGAPFGSESTQYAYDLTALTPRVVDANLIADTDKGWFRWNVSGIALINVKRYIHTYPRDPARIPGPPYTIAASPTLAVDFPVAVAVRHVWIESGLALGDPSLKWNGKNISPCEVPAFDAARDKQPDPDLSLSRPASYAPAVAASAQAPFDIGYCALKFASGTAISPVPPDYNPNSEAGAYGYAATVAVALDPNGHPIDTWLYAGSGYGPFDLATLRAAKASKYAGGVSYCRQVSSRYLFMGVIFPTL